MTISDEIAIAGVSVTFIGIIITAIFTWMVWCATKRSADVAEASYTLAKTITDKSNRDESNFRTLYRRIVYSSLARMANALLDVKNKGPEDRDYIITSLLNIIDGPEVDTEVLAKHFTSEEVGLIQSTFSLIRKIKDHQLKDVIDGQGNFRVMYQIELHAIRHSAQLAWNHTHKTLTLLQKNDETNEQMNTGSVSPP